MSILSLAYSPDGQAIATGCGGFNNYSDIGFARLRSASDGSATRRADPGWAGRSAERGVFARRTPACL